MDDCDYVIVGSGAGGGTLAARLAEAGMRVVVLEAGGDPRDGAGLPEDYDVPAFHPLASENPGHALGLLRAALRGRGRGSAAIASCSRDGIYYPRAGTLGGCTAHNAMILMAPHDADWDGIAALTGDASWRATDMRRYFQRLEQCRYRPAWRTLSRLGLDPTGHGWDGWLPTECAMPWQVLEDRRLLATLTESAFARAARIVAPGASPPATGGVATGPERPARAADAMPMGSASRRSAPTGTSGWERASACSTSRRAIRIG